MEIKIRTTVKTSKTVETSNEKDFYSNVKEILNKMLGCNPEKRLFPLEEATNDISIHLLDSLSHHEKSIKCIL